MHEGFLSECLIAFIFVPNDDKGQIPDRYYDEHFVNSILGQHLWLPKEISAKNNSTITTKSLENFIVFIPDS